MRVAKINPDLLRWARESINYSLAAAARRLDVDVTRLSAWENGSEQISIAQVRKAADLYKRPLAVFYLSERPKSFGVMKDFRRLPDHDPLSPEVMLEVRNANARRELAVDLADDTDEKPLRFPVQASPKSSPEEVGQQLRSALNVPVAVQRGWRDPRKAANAWREAAEGLGVLVFRGSFPLKEARGFSIGTDVFPVVVFNVNDSYAGRAFTMLHELAHVALRSGGVCDLHEDGGTDTEKWCNRVAAEALLPRQDLEQEPDVASLTKRGRAHLEKTIENLARRYSVSEEVVTIRLIEIGRAPDDLYDQLRSRFRRLAALAENARQQRSGGGEAPAQKSVNERGHVLARLVLTSYGEQRLTVNEVTSYLGIRAKQLTNVAAEVRRKVSGE